MRRLARISRVAGVAAVAAGAAVLALAPASRAHAAGTGVTIDTACTSGSLYCFVPASSSVTSGDTITWTNMTSAPHTATLCTPAACSGAPANSAGCDAFDVSVASGAGATGTHTFSGTGTCFYYCRVHGYSVMHGSVTVAAAATPAPTPTGPSRVPTPPTGAAIPLDLLAALVVVGGVVLALSVSRRDEL